MGVFTLLKIVKTTLNRGKRHILAISTWSLAYLKATGTEILFPTNKNWLMFKLHESG